MCRPRCAVSTSCADRSSGPGLHDPLLEAAPAVRLAIVSTDPRSHAGSGAGVLVEVNPVPALPSRAPPAPGRRRAWPRCGRSHGPSRTGRGQNRDVSEEPRRLGGPRRARLEIARAAVFTCSRSPQTRRMIGKCELVSERSGCDLCMPQSFAMADVLLQRCSSERRCTSCSRSLLLELPMTAGRDAHGRTPRASARANGQEFGAGAVGVSVSSTETRSHCGGLPPR
jgi:hypothetical protein